MDRGLSDLQDYLDSTTLFPKAPKNKVWWLSARESLLHYFHETGQVYSKIDYRYTRGLMDHKYLMQVRMAYF